MSREVQCDVELSLFKKSRQRNRIAEKQRRTKEKTGKVLIHRVRVYCGRRKKKNLFSLNAFSLPMNHESGGDLSVRVETADEGAFECLKVTLLPVGYKCESPSPVIFIELDSKLFENFSWSSAQQIVLFRPTRSS